MNDLFKRYLAGESAQALAKVFKIDRATIRKRLIRAGITPRGRSQAMYARMARTSPAERQRLTASAHDAVRGRRHSAEQRCKIALTRERNRTGISRKEHLLANALRAEGLNPIHQKAFGRYNVDISLTQSAIAVEVFGGHWHTTGAHAARFRKRCDYLINAGWTPVIVWVTPNYPIERGIIDYIVALDQALRRSKPVRRQEHVLRGDGQPTAIGKANLNYRKR